MKGDIYNYTPAAWGFWTWWLDTWRTLEWGLQATFTLPLRRNGTWYRWLAIGDFGHLEDFWNSNGDFIGTWWLGVLEDFGYSGGMGTWDLVTCNWWLWPWNGVFAWGLGDLSSGDFRRAKARPKAVQHWARPTRLHRLARTRSWMGNAHIQLLRRWLRVWYAVWCLRVFPVRCINIVRKIPWLLLFIVKKTSRSPLPLN